MSHIFYHIATKSDWEKALERQEYIVPSLEEEGFIHASYWEQLEATAGRYYKGQSDLLILQIDASKLKASLKVEYAPSINQDFPHIYGPLNLNAVIATAPFSVSEDGSAALPTF